MPFTNKGIIRFLVFLTGYVLFLVIGGSLLAAIEEPNEIKAIQKVRNLKNEFMIKTNISTKYLEQYSLELIQITTGRGIFEIGNNTEDLSWSLGPAFFFASTLVTTIGYGHVTPKSRSGKIFVIIYAMVGIPLTLVLISAIVERLLYPTVWLLRVLNDKLGDRLQQFNIRLIHLGILLTILSSFFYVIPAVIFDYIESKWDYLDALYFCFISLTTVGLGDLIPGDSGDVKYLMTYKICVTVYLYLGISFMMLTLAVFYDIPQLNLGDLYQPDDDLSHQKVRLTTTAQGAMPDAISVRTHQSNNKGRDSIREGTIRSINYTSDESDSPPHQFTKPKIKKGKTKEVYNSS